MSVVHFTHWTEFLRSDKRQDGDIRNPDLCRSHPQCTQLSQGPLVPPQKAGGKLTVLRALYVLLFHLRPDGDEVLAVVPGVGHGDLAPMQDVVAAGLLQHGRAFLLPERGGAVSAGGGRDRRRGGTSGPAVAPAGHPGAGGGLERAGPGGGEGTQEGDTHSALGLDL